MGSTMPIVRELAAHSTKTTSDPYSLAERATQGLISLSLDAVTASLSTCARVPNQPRDA